MFSYWDAWRHVRFKGSFKKISDVKPEDSSARTLTKSEGSENLHCGTAGTLFNILIEFIEARQKKAVFQFCITFFLRK